MFTNSKKNADILPNSNGLTKVKTHGHGFITYRDRINPKARRWARVICTAKLVELPLKKADVVKLPTPLPMGIALVTRKIGAVTRQILTGTESAIQHVTKVAGIS